MVNTRFYEHIPDEQHPYYDILQIYHVLSIPGHKIIIKKIEIADKMYLLTSQNIRWVGFADDLSIFVGSVFRLMGSNRELSGFLKYNIWIKPQSSPNIKVASSVLL